MFIVEVFFGYILVYFGYIYLDFDLIEWICRRIGELYNFR